MTEPTEKDPRLIEEDEDRIPLDGRIFPPHRGRLRRSVSAFTALVATVLIASALAFGGAVALTVTSGHSTDNRILNSTKHGRAELCRFIDLDHNRQRGDLVRGHTLLYQVPAFRILVSTPRARRAAYKDAKKRYDSIRDSRPPFCDAFADNTVKPFPPLSHFMRGQHAPSAPPETPQPSQK